MIQSTFWRLSQEIRDIDEMQITSSTANKLYTNSTSSDKSVEIVADNFINNNNSSNILSDQLDASGGNNFSYIDSDFNTILFK